MLLFRICHYLILKEIVKLVTQDRQEFLMNMIGIFLGQLEGFQNAATVNIKHFLNQLKFLQPLLNNLPSFIEG